MWVDETANVYFKCESSNKKIKQWDQTSSVILIIKNFVNCSKELQYIPSLQDWSLPS